MLEPTPPCMLSRSPLA